MAELDPEMAEVCSLLRGGSMAPLFRGFRVQDLGLMAGTWL